METETLPKLKTSGQNGGVPGNTCRVIIVQPGISDKVLKVHPSEHEAEKIWLDNTQGIERWEAVKRFMFQFAKRGTAIPNPVPFCKSKNLAVADLQEHEIPIVELEDGVFLKAPPKVERLSRTELPKPVSDPEMDKRVSGLEKGLETLTALVSGIAERLNKAGQIAAQAQAASGPSHQLKCDDCDRTFATKLALGSHKYRSHRKEDK